MFKKSFLIITFLSLPLCTVTRESQVYSDWWGTEQVSNQGEDLYNYIQNGCSHLLGEKFSKIDPRKRKQLYDSIRSGVHYHCGGSRCSEFVKTCVDARIKERIIDLVAQKTKERLKNSTTDLTDAEAVYNTTKKELEDAAHLNGSSSESYGLKKGFFEKALDDQTMVDRINKIRKQHQSSSYVPPYHGGREAEFSHRFWKRLLNWISGHKKPSQQIPEYERPPATNPNWCPKPSAPPYED